MVANVLVLFISAIFLLPLASALNEQPYHLKLLAVQEAEDGYEGSGADLFLELREGSSRVFLETTPLTKLDTQISTKFAKEIACKHFKLNCQKYDFIYTIKAESNIIGGPSAGAAIAALTTIAVLDLKHDETVAITGTINSGGIIGPVGGVKEKLDAAEEIGLDKVLVAKGSFVPPDLSNDSNSSEELFDLAEYVKENLSLEMVEVIDLDEAIFYLTGRELNHKETDVIEDQQYTEIMQGLKNILCERTEKIKVELEQENVYLNENVTAELLEKKGLADNATLDEDFYSAASYCFAANIILKLEYYKAKMPSSQAVNNLFSVLEKKTVSMKEQLNQEKIDTISCLQAMMIVQERLSDTEKQINEFKEMTSADFVEREAAYNTLAYAEERYFSALSWKQFFAMDGKKFVMDDEKLKNSCQQKISEADEMHQYVSLFIGLLPVVNIQEKISLAETAQENHEYVLCLITASKVKADANAILSSLGWMEENFAEFIESKNKAVERVISENSAEGIFPILGYSYYKYANSLKGQEPYTALIYLEYALEMSELSIYFPEEQGFLEREFRIEDKWWYALIGFVLGAFMTFLAAFFLTRKKVKKKSRSKSKAISYRKK